MWNREEKLWTSLILSETRRSELGLSGVAVFRLGTG